MSNPILWPKYFLKAAIDYFNARLEKPAIIIDNAILQDGVLATREKVSGDDCVVCLSQEYIANFEVDDFGISFSAKFNGFYHHLAVPYEAISAVFAYKSNCMINDQGEMNLLTLPKVILPPGAIRRNQSASDKEHLNQTVLLNLEDQPLGDAEHSHAPIVASFKR